MAHEEHDPQDVRATRSARRDTQPTARLTSQESSYGDPLNPNWRRERAAGRSRRMQALPSSWQEFTLWLQYGGWRIVSAVVAVVVLLILGSIVLMGPRQPLQSASEDPEITEQLPQVIPDQPTVTPGPAVPTQPPAAAGGATFQVIGTGAEGLFLRSEPNTNNQPLKTLPEGTLVTIIGEDFVGPDRVWKQVRDPEGSEGWVAADFLQSAP